MSKQNLLNILDNVDFDIRKIDILLKNLDELVRFNIPYKQRLYDLIYSRLVIEDKENNLLLCISLLFDDFLDIYSQLGDYKNFHIKLVGLFNNLDISSFTSLLNEFLYKNIFIDYDNFYFILEFLSEFIEFNYMLVFLDSILFCYNDFFYNVYDSSDLSDSIYRKFKIAYLFDDAWENNRYLIDSNKKIVISILEFLMRYIKFIYQNKVSNKQLEVNLDIACKLFNYLYDEMLDIGDYEKLIYLYNYIVIDCYDIYISSIYKLKDRLKYILHPILNAYSIDEFNIICRITIAYINGKDYVKLLYDIGKYEDVTYDDIIHILKLIYSEKKLRKTSIINFVHRFDSYILNSFNCNELCSIISYISFIINCIVEDDSDISDLHSVVDFILKNSDYHLYKLNYKLLKKIIGIHCVELGLPFEGMPFYFKVKNSTNIIYDKIDEEYIYARYAYINSNEECEIEKTTIINYMEKYFLSQPQGKRDLRKKYYGYLINTKYLDIYKFELVNHFKYLNDGQLRDECDFLIYNSTSEQSFKLGITLSTIFDKCIYMDAYICALSVLTWGDIFYEIYNKYGVLYSESIHHQSYNFHVKFNFRMKYRDVYFCDIYMRNKLLTEDLYSVINSYTCNLNSRIFIYDILFSNHYVEKNDSINLLTLKLKTLIEIIKSGSENQILKDKILYSKLKFYLGVYTVKFVSFTQFNVLNEMKNVIISHFSDLNKLENKEIEDGYRAIHLKRNICENETVKFINDIMNGDLSKEYFDNIFNNGDIELVIDIINNESELYDERLILFRSYIHENTLDVLFKIYKMSTKNSYIGKMFIGILNYYPDAMISILNKQEHLSVFKKMMEVISLY